MHFDDASKIDYSRNCTKNHIFFFRTSWKDGLSKKLRWNIIILVLSGKMIFIFPKIWSYTLDGKWKMIFLKKYTEIYFLQAFWKYGLSKRCRAGTWSFLHYLERWYFFPENMIFLPWAESERRPFPAGNTWKHDTSPSEKKTGSLIHRAEVWPLLKFIRLEIFHNE